MAVGLHVLSIPAGAGSTPAGWWEGRKDLEDRTSPFWVSTRIAPTPAQAGIALVLFSSRIIQDL